MLAIRSWLELRGIAESCVLDENVARAKRQDVHESVAVFLRDSSIHENWPIETVWFGQLQLLADELLKARRRVFRGRLWPSGVYDRLGFEDSPVRGLDRVDINASDIGLEGQLPTVCRFEGLRDDRVQLAA